MARRYVTYVCDLSYTPGVTPLTIRDSNCQYRARHTPEPEGYVAWHEWARLMGKTHRQQRCPGCNLWTIWIPKSGAGTASRQTNKDAAR